MRGTSALADIGELADLWNSKRMSDFMRAMAESRARLFNAGTLSRLQNAMLDAEDVTGRVSAAEQSFL